MALASINARPLVATAPKPAGKSAPQVVAAPAPSTGNSVVKAARAIGEVAPSAAIGTVGTALGMRGAVFTPPLIVDIVKDSLRSGVSLTNLAWFVVPSAIRNVRDITNGKISIGRGTANVATDTTVGVVKGIAAGVAVQSLSVAVGPLLGALPAAVLPFAGLAVGIGGLIGTYYVLGKVVTKTGLDKKLSDGLTKLLGGDKTPAKA